MGVGEAVGISVGVGVGSKLLILPDANCSNRKASIDVIEPDLSTSAAIVVYTGAANLPDDSCSARSASTAVTAPFSRQSMLAGGYVFIIERTGVVFTLRPLYPDNLDLNSALLRSECLLIFKV